MGVEWSIFCVYVEERERVSWFSDTICNTSTGGPGGVGVGSSVLAPVAVASSGARDY